MKQKNHTRLYITYVIIGVMLLLVSVSTISFSYFRTSTTNSQTLSNIVVTTECLNITYSEGLTTIDLDYQYPISDTYAVSNVDPLIITVTNHCTNNSTPVNYDLTLATLSDSENFISDDKMKVLVKRTMDGGSEEVFKPTQYLNSLDKLISGSTYTYLVNDLADREDLEDYDVNNIYHIDINSIGNEETNTYKVYLWIDYYEGDLSKTGLNDNTTQNKAFNGTLSIVLNSTRVNDLDFYFNGSGTVVDPYQIRFAEDLVKLSQLVNDGNDYSGKYFALKSDIDFNNPDSYDNSSRTDFGDLNGNGVVESIKTELTTGKGFTPIGNDTNRFGGNFNGNNHEISNLYINNTTLNRLGLFGVINNSIIENLTLGGSITTTNNSGLTSGSICGASYGTSIINNYHSKVDITGGQYATGLVSINYGTLIINNTSNEGDIYINANNNIVVYAAGFTINNGYAYIINSYNSGNITGLSNSSSNDYVSGIAFSSNNSYNYFINSYNAGDLISNDRTNGVTYGTSSSNYIYINNTFNIGSMTNKNDAACRGIAYAGSTKKNSYDVTNSYCVGSTECFSMNTATGTSSNIVNQNIESFNTQAFVNSLNTNKAGINLASINSALADYTLYDWKLGADGYPVFDIS